MYGCATHRSSKAGDLIVPEASGLVLRVEDMTCGHCAAKIRKAVEGAVPGAQVDPDPATKLVAVRGTANLHTVRAAITIRAAIAAAGYTPSA
jgi:copper chaperone